MKFKPNYILIPLGTLIIAGLGSAFTSSGMLWYNTELILPSITPPRWVFPLAWNIIFILATIAVLILWNKKEKGPELKWLKGLILINALLNVLWSFLFFSMQWIMAALIEMILLELTMVPIIALAWNRSKWAALCFVPYALWVGFATYLTYIIWMIN